MQNLLGWNNVGGGDYGYIWRVQTKRSMDHLDELIQLKLYYANKLGPEKVQEIEADVGLFADADQFRIYHAKGRFRGTICAMAFTGTLFTLMNGGSNGRAAMKQNKLLACAVFGGSLVTFYTLWSRVAGFNNQVYNEFQYARVHKMLRNAQIKQ